MQPAGTIGVVCFFHGGFLLSQLSTGIKQIPAHHVFADSKAISDPFLRYLFKVEEDHGLSLQSAHASDLLMQPVCLYLLFRCLRYQFRRILYRL